MPRWDGESVVGADQAVVEFNVDMGCAGLNFTEVWVTGAFCEWCSPYGGPYGGALQLFKTGEDDSSAIFSGSFVFDADSMSLNDDGEPAVFYRYLADGWQQPEALNAIGGGGSSVEIAGSTVGPPSASKSKQSSFRHQRPSPNAHRRLARPYSRTGRRSFSSPTA